jgi:hypothetical protein
MSLVNKDVSSHVAVDGTPFRTLGTAPEEKECLIACPPRLGRRLSFWLLTLFSGGRGW